MFLLVGFPPTLPRESDPANRVEAPASEGGPEVHEGQQDPPLSPLPLLPLTASRRGQDKRGRHRSAAINFPVKMLQNVPQCAHPKQNITKCIGFVALL